MGTEREGEEASSHGHSPWSQFLPPGAWSWGPEQVPCPLLFMQSHHQHPSGPGTQRGHLPPCPAAASSRRKARTLSGGPASAFGAASLQVPGSPEQRGRQDSSTRPSGDPPPLTTCPAWAASQSRRPTSAWESDCLRARVTLPRARCPRQPAPQQGCEAKGTASEGAHRTSVSLGSL